LVDKVREQLQQFKPTRERAGEFVSFVLDDSQIDWSTANDQHAGAQWLVFTELSRHYFDLCSSYDTLAAMAEKLCCSEPSHIIPLGAQHQLNDSLAKVVAQMRKLSEVIVSPTITQRVDRSPKRRIQKPQQS